MIRRLAPWLGLLAASILLWQVRFSAVPHPLNGDAGFEQGLDGWITEGGPTGLRTEDGSTIVRFARPADHGEFSSAGLWLGPLENLRYLRVDVEARWADVVMGQASWARPRLVLITRDEQNRIGFPLDHGAYLAFGTRDWHHEETVFELTPAMHEVGLAFQMLGKEGTMEVRRFRLTALRRRPWVPAATVLLLAGWILWLGSCLRGLEREVAWWRALAAAVMVIAGSWYLVFPGPRMQSRPLVGTFLTGKAASGLPVAASGQPSLAKTPATRPAGSPDKPTTGDPPLDSPSAAVTPQPPPAASPARPPPEPRSRPIITSALRKLDHKVNLLHFGAFFSLSLGVFLAAGLLAPWRLLAIVGALSEAVPGWQRGRVDPSDLLDLITNLTGVALAAGAFVLLARLGRKLKPPAPEPD